MRYLVTTKAYGVEPGATISLNPADPLVILNVQSGVLEPDPSAPLEKMTCPTCAGQMKRPPKLASPDELHDHYEDKHPGLVTPPWSADNEGSEKK